MMINSISQRTFNFAFDIIKFCKTLKEEKEYILYKQLLRSGTSIGANVREAQNAESKPDFIHKMGIAQKETDETIYWLELSKLTLSDVTLADKIDTLLKEANELLKIIRTIILNTKQNIKKK